MVYLLKGEEIAVVLVEDYPEAPDDRASDYHTEFWWLDSFEDYRFGTPHAANASKQPVGVGFQ
jgi:hypothetical protein